MRLRENKKSTKVDFLSLDSITTREVKGGFSWRFLNIYVLAIFIFTFLLFNLFNLQIIEGSQNLLLASRINQSTSIILPPRGLIYDAQGNKLAYNIPAYSLFVKPLEVNADEEESDVRKIAEVINVNPDEFWETYKAKIFSEEKRIESERVTIKSDFTLDQYLGLVTIADQLQGFYLNVEPVREYVNSSYFSNIIGYVGDPTQADVDDGIYSEAQVGKIGVEKQYDKVLRGTEGIQISEKGLFDDRQRVFTPQEMKYGDNIFLTIDSSWQMKLTEIMRAQSDTVGAFASAGVIMNSRTGEVKAMVTLPGYDNNLFAKGIGAKDFSRLINDPRTPLLNRPIALQLPPGSIWKVIGATAGLETNVINENTEFFSNRCMELPGDIKFCEADAGYLGNIDLKDALAKSSNIYFCNVALQLNSKSTGIRALIDYGERYGIGKATGIDLPGEGAGTMASPELKKKLLNEPWYLGDECNTIIGQGLVTVTPLQMTVVAAAISNGGKVLEPHVLSRIEDQTGNTIYAQSPVVTRNLDVSSKTLDIIRSAMRRTVLAGTAGDLRNSPGEVIAKTGSSDAGEYIQGKYYSGAHSWVMGCFDYSEENYCFTIMQQWGGRGYKTVPIMKKFINCVYNDFTNECENV